MRWSARRRTLAVGALIALFATILAACSSGGSSSTTTSSASSSVSLGPIKQATGAPLVVGYDYVGQTQSIDTRPELAIAEATVKYVNTHLGGVNGRPLKLLTCADNDTPAGATDCANQMIAAKVPVVLATEPTQPASVMNELGPAKIPYFVYSGTDPSLFTSTDAFVLANPLSVIAAPIKLAKQSGVKKVGIVYIDLPAAAETPALATSLYAKQGLSVVTAAVPSGTPDMTPQIQAAVSKGAQAFLILGDPSFCISALGAMKTIGFSGDVTINSECLSPAVAKAVPGGINGVKVASTSVLVATSPLVRTYTAVVAAYAPGTQPYQDGEEAYPTILGFVRAMAGLNASNVTAATVAQALRTMAPQPQPMLPGQTFQCNGKASTLSPSICSQGGAIITLNAAGNPVSFQTFNAATYMNG